MGARWDREMASLVMTEDDRRRSVFHELPIDAQHAEWIRRRAWVRTLNATTRIEGNSLSEIQVEDLLNERSIRVSRREALEILGVRSALGFVDDIIARRDVPLGEDVVREIHRRVLEDIDAMLTPGRYRQGPNRVTDADGETIFTTPPSGDVPDLMRAFGHGLRDASALPAPIAAALAHLEFVAIHPFYDGNGRTSRAIARLLLGRGGYDFDGLVSLDAYLDLDRQRYFRAIAETTGGSYRSDYDATPFVGYFLGAAIAATDHTLGRLRGLAKVAEAVRREVTAGVLPAGLLDGLVYAWINRSMRPADYIAITRRTKQSATRDLNVATRLGYLSPSGGTKARRFAVGPRLDEMSL